MSTATTRAICVTPDANRRKALRRALFAAGRQVEFLNDLDELFARAPEVIEGALVVVETGPPTVPSLHERLARLRPAEIVALGEDLSQEGSIDLLRICDHLLGASQGGGAQDEDEIFVTTVKLRSQDLFGLEKYLAWGVDVHEEEVRSYDDKRLVLDRIADYAREAGARRQTATRIEAVADELIMNALYDAPAVLHGSREQLQERAHPGGGPVTDQRVIVRYGSDGGNFAISVGDSFGELRKDVILDHLERARDQHGAPKEDATVGPGLGLYFVLNSVTRFIANVAPGRATEVIALFDLRTAGRDQPAAARSVSIFTARA